MRNIIVLLCITVLVTNCKNETTPESKLITTEELADYMKIEDIQLIDVRTPEEYQEGYIDGFQNIDYLADDFEEKMETLDKSKPVIVHCRSGKRSASCAKKMVEAGFVKVYDLDGGIAKWIAEEGEVVIPK